MLIVEDDPLVLMVAAEALRDAGLAVVEADTADEATRILREGAGAFHAVFSDIEMPGKLNGIALAHMISETWPDIAVILASGRIRPTEDELPFCTHFLCKPYDLNHIAALIILSCK